MYLLDKIQAKNTEQWNEASNDPCVLTLVLLGRTWFRNFRVLGVRQNSHLKQAKLGTLEYSRVNQAIVFELWKNNTIRLLRRRKKNDKIHVLSISFNNYHIFSISIIIRTYRKRQKNISVQCRQCSSILFWNRSCDCSVYTTLEDGVAGVRRYRCSSTTWLLFCLFGVKGVKGTAKSSLPLMIVCFDSFDCQDESSWVEPVLSKDKWALTWENLSSGFPTKLDSIQYLQLQRLALSEIWLVFVWFDSLPPINNLSVI